MAGTILILKDVGLPLSSLAFDHLVEEVRRSIASPAPAEFSDAYRPYDHEGMMFIDLAGLSAEAFQTFVASTHSAAHTCAESHGKKFERAWAELAQALMKDPRARAAEKSV